MVSQAQLYFIVFSLLKDVDYQKQRFPCQTHCLSALHSRLLDSGSGPVTHEQISYPTPGRSVG